MFSDCSPGSIEKIRRTFNRRPARNAGARTQWFACSEPCLENRIRFVKRADKGYTYDTLEDLRDMLIGVVSNYAYAPGFDDSRDLIKIPANHVIQDLSLLQQGRLDLTLDDEHVLRHKIGTYMPNSVDRFVFLDKPLASRGLHMPVSRANNRYEEIIVDFNREIRAMKEDGSFAAILREYQKVYPSISEGSYLFD